MKPQYFTITDEEGKTAGVIKASNDKEFESMIMDCIIGHFCADDASLEQSLQMEWFKNHLKPQSVKVRYMIDGESYNQEIKIFHTVIYEEPQQITRDQFMAFFRSDDYNQQLSADDCLEVFATAVKGESDLTVERFNKILSDYGSGLQVMDQEIALTAAYIVTIDLLGGTFFQTYDRALDIAKEFVEKYPSFTKWGENNKEWDETIETFVLEKTAKPVA